MRRLLTLVLLIATPAGAETCRVGFDLAFDEAIGALPAETALSGMASFTTLDPLRQPGNRLSFTTDGQLSIAAPDGAAVEAEIVDMHISRTDGSLDYVSFNARRAAGDLGGQRIEANPILVTWYGPNGTLPGDGFPTAAEWENLTRRRVVQMRIVGTTRYYFGKISATSVDCD